MEDTELLKTLPYQHPPYLCGMGDVGMEVVGMGVGIRSIMLQRMPKV
jgi:hypothetical protein